MRAFLADLWSSPDGADANSTIEANAFQVAALFDLWCDNLGVGFDFLAALKFGKSKMVMYETFSWPTAVAMKNKGAMLTMEESDIIMREAAHARKKPTKEKKRK